MANASLAPVLLVSMPQMLDPNFSKTVVLLAEYGAHGAFGLVVNRRMDEPAMSIVTADDPLDIHPKMYLYTGGPVEPTRAWILTAKEDLDPEALEVMKGVYLSASPTIVRRTLESAPDPGVRMVVGYAGLGLGPARRRARAGRVVAGAGAARPDFRDRRPTSMWEAAIRRLGAEPSMLARIVGRSLGRPTGADRANRPTGKS